MPAVNDPIVGGLAGVAAHDIAGDVFQAFFGATKNGELAYLQKTGSNTFSWTLVGAPTLSPCDFAVGNPSAIGGGVTSDSFRVAFRCADGELAELQGDAFGNLSTMAWKSFGRSVANVANAAAEVHPTTGWSAVSDPAIAYSFVLGDYVTTVEESDGNVYLLVGDPPAQWVNVGNPGSLATADLAAFSGAPTVPAESSLVGGAVASPSALVLDQNGAMWQAVISSNTPLITWRNLGITASNCVPTGDLTSAAVNDGQLIFARCAGAVPIPMSNVVRTDQIVAEKIPFANQSQSTMWPAWNPGGGVLSQPQGTWSTGAESYGAMLTSGGNSIPWLIAYEGGSISPKQQSP